MIIDFENRWDIDLSYLGVYPQKLEGAYGILFSPLLHGDVWHLVSNTFPLLILGTALYYFYEKIANRVVLIIYFLSGIVLWIGLSPFPYNNFLVRESFHIGASGIVYGLAAFLIFSGIFRKNKESLSIALAVVFLYGGLLYGVFPQETGISYEAHLFGALSGLIAAYFYKDVAIWKKQKIVESTPDFRQTNSQYIFQPEHYKQNASTLVMVRPLNFGFNAETSKSNIFQNSSFLISNKDIKEKALAEFDGFAKKLQFAGINILVFEDQHHKTLPDAVFPNNWISFHQDGRVIKYPMLSKARREERRDDIVDLLAHKYKYLVAEKIDFTDFEGQDIFLEGTGSIVFDHSNKKAYANISSRTDENLFRQYCYRLNYIPMIFRSLTKDGNEVYHTNVMLSIGENFAVICSDTIKNPEERTNILTNLRNDKRHIIEITEEQMIQFCGNILQVENVSGYKYIAMSSTAFDNFTDAQINTLKLNGGIIHSNLATIENYGGGSARCMLAEVLLPKHQ